jgi:hypothetical protein
VIALLVLEHPVYLVHVDEPALTANRDLELPL